MGVEMCRGFMRHNGKRQIGAGDLWKLTVNFLSVSKSHKNYNIIFNDDANAIITAADPVCRFVSCHFFQAGNITDRVGV